MPYQGQDEEKVFQVQFLLFHSDICEDLFQGMLLFNQMHGLINV